MLRPVFQQALRSCPSQCGVCRQWGSSALCQDCCEHFAATVPRCTRCGLRLGLAAAVCGACLRQPPAFEHTFCAVDYGFPWDQVITAFKFEGRIDWSPALAELLHRALPAEPGPGAELVVPVPLSSQRLAERGYNQAWELARRVAARRQVPARHDLLLRPLETAHQADLGRSERQLNLRRAFMVEPRHRSVVQGRQVALVDDVMTTGATANEASAALLRAGAKSVQLWVLARTEGF